MLLHTVGVKNDPCLKGNCSLYIKSIILANISLNEGHVQIHFKIYLTEGQLASINFTAAMRISNCRGWLASLLRLQLSLVLERTPKLVHFSPSLSKNKKCYCCCQCCCCCPCCCCWNNWDHVVSLDWWPFKRGLSLLT